ncbi:MAG: Sulfurtransferase TusA (modular protein) [Promethearchaeota archaeon]|jgi:tRNA 2-thiouridine synthesizing protein A|nr:MAG: Sulfurtransferase TusA (modular protein) [Candidatus Lokiarchaeota archaeon]
MHIFFISKLDINNSIQNKFGTEGIVMKKNPSEKERFDVEVDTRGLFCPEPLLKVKDESADLEIGQCFKVMTDDPAAEREFREWAQETGTEIVDFNQGDSELVFYFRKDK